MSILLNSERREAIAQRLARGDRVLAADLAQEFATSEDTIRRDLRALAAAGLCRRVYGGALPVPPGGGPVSARAQVAPDAKAALGAALAGLVLPGMTVFLDAGSTVLAAARAITAEGVTLVTHAPLIAAALAERSEISLVVLGGRIDPIVGAAVGARALAEAEGLRPDLALLGACGLDPDAGLTAHSVEDAAFKRRLASASAMVAVAADRIKIGTAAAFAVIGTDACDVLALEASTPTDLLARFRAAGPRVLEVETNGRAGA